MMPEIEHLPFIAINVFIEREYLENVVKEVLEGINQLSKQDQGVFSQVFRKYVSVLGFRNPLRAPQPLQINAYASAFEGKEEVIPFTLSTWTKLHIDIAEKVKDWLAEEGWENLALERSYEEAAGFIQDWPEELSFEQLEESFSKANPDLAFNRNDLILLVLWISGKLPAE